MKKPRLLNLCFILLIFSLAINISYAETKSSYDKKLKEAEKLLENPRTRKKAFKQLTVLTNLTKKKDFPTSSVGYRALAVLADETRKGDNSSSKNKIFQQISSYNDFSIISDWPANKPEGAYFNPKLLPMLELAHYLAIDKDNPKVPESMKILNFAESKTQTLMGLLTIRQLR